MTRALLLLVLTSSLLLSGCTHVSQQKSSDLSDVRVQTGQSQAYLNLSDSQTTNGQVPAQQNQAGNQNTERQVMENVTELKALDRQVGTGAEAVAGKTVTVHYTGTFTDGQKFDSSLDRNQPFSFTLGAGQVIEGWDVGVAGMKVGGKRQLVIPPDMGYGPSGIPGAIPGNATLVFEVELLEVK